MQTAVWKFALEAGGRTKVTMPAGAEVFSIALQGREIVVYAHVCVAPDTPKVERTFLVTGTGHVHTDLPPARWLGTLEPVPGLFFHVAEVLTPSRNQTSRESA